ncbi:hypothetical protein KSF78_0008141 [Schistosoma japonicum]|nr:hypothetical protein KSF78_0008141 [Schistosoma japonicum]
MLTTNRPFIWIRFGENNKVLVNMWCSSEILLNHIISVCDIDPERRLLGLSEAQTFQQTIQSLEGGAVYILVIIEVRSTSECSAMLTNFEQYYPNLTEPARQVRKIYQEKTSEANAIASKGDNQQKSQKVETKRKSFIKD